MQLLTINELMSFLKVKRNTVYELRRKGLPVIHLGRSVRFERDEIIKWVRSNCSVNTGTTSTQVTLKPEMALSPMSGLSQNATITGNLSLIPLQGQATTDYLL